MVICRHHVIKPVWPQVDIPYMAKLSRGKTFAVVHKHTIHWKTFAVHQAHAIMYCTQQIIQGENFRDWLKNRENRESFPPRKFCRIRYSYLNHTCDFMHSCQQQHSGFCLLGKILLTYSILHFNFSYCHLFQLHVIAI